jgi:SPP1 gp7 family putative phage head morphogenesis protein
VPAVKADLAGQLMVRRGIGDQRIQMADPAQKPSFLDMPWADAINEFIARGIVKPNELSTLMGDYAQRADVARRLMLENIQKEVRAQLERSLRDGGTYQQFAAALDEKKVSLGIADTDPSYLKMVFRTNVQGAYGAGRFKAMKDPVVQAARPYVQYRTVGDARVRPTHAVLDGTTYDASGGVWERICPPNNYNCRCSAVMLTPEEAAGKQILGAVPASYVPDADFDGPPVARLPVPSNDNSGT